MSIEAPRRAWDRFSGSHFAGMNDHDSFRAACEVLREELARELEERLPDRCCDIDGALDAVFEKVKADA